jgi:hypothetical protein
MPFANGAIFARGCGMKKTLILGFLLLGLTQSSAQDLPSYDLSYYDSARCIKDVMNLNSEDRGALPNTEQVAKTICSAERAMDQFTRARLEKKWNVTPSNIRLFCIALANEASRMKSKNENYADLSKCIDYRIRKDRRGP